MRRVSCWNTGTSWVKQRAWHSARWRDCEKLEGQQNPDKQCLYPAIAGLVARSTIYSVGMMCAPALPPTPALRRLVVAACLLCSAMASSWAQSQAPTLHPATANAWAEQARQWIQQEVSSSAEAPNALALRPHIEVGRLDPRLRLAPCQHVQPYLPQGTRLWGRSRIGLRCVQGPVAWNVFLPVTVQVWGPAWVVRQPIAPGTLLTQAHAELTEIDWAQGSTAVIARAEDWVGSVAARAIMPGQALRQGMVRTPQVFAAGTQVRVILQGNGFELSATGEAISTGHVGQTARVRMPDRRVLSGIVRDAETVEMRL